MELINEYNSDSDSNKQIKRKHSDDSDNSDYDSDNINFNINYVKGRYISKREKIEIEKHIINYPIIKHDEKYYESLNIPSDLVNMTNKTLNENIIPNSVKYTFKEHKESVNRIQWCNNKGHLLASASMDKTIKIFDVFRKTTSILTMEYEDNVVDVKWNNDNTRLLSCSTDSYAHLLDIETGKKLDSFKHKECVTTVSFHPRDDNLFLVGSFSKGIVCWDIRTHSVISTYQGVFGEVQDLAFIDVYI